MLIRGSLPIVSRQRRPFEADEVDVDARSRPARARGTACVRSGPGLRARRRRLSCGNDREGASDSTCVRLRPELREQVGGDTAAIHGSGPDVVDRRDFLGQDASCASSSDCAGGKRRLGPRRAHDGRRDAAERDANDAGPDPREGSNARPSRPSRSPGPRASRLSGTTAGRATPESRTPAISSSGRRTVAR